MIQAKELRLNNYINHKELGIVKVISISSKLGDYESIFVESLKDGLDYYFNLDQDLIAIPLTEEILLKVGFKVSINKTCYGMITESGKTRLSIFHDGLFKVSYEDLEIKVKHLHQLQNLFFALTGKNLDVKL